MLYFALRRSNEYDSVEEVAEKRKKHEVDPEIPMKILFRYPPAL